MLCPFEGVNDASDLRKAVLEVEFRCRAANVPPSYLPFKGAHLRGAFMVSVFGRIVILNISIALTSERFNSHS